MSVVMQESCCGFLKIKRFIAWGGVAAVQVDMRVIAATNVPLKGDGAEGKMRSYFYYRINVFPSSLFLCVREKLTFRLLVQDFSFIVIP